MLNLFLHEKLSWNSYLVFQIQKYHWMKIPAHEIFLNDGGKFTRIWSYIQTKIKK